MNRPSRALTRARRRASEAGHRAGRDADAARVRRAYVVSRAARRPVIPTARKTLAGKTDLTACAESGVDAAGPGWQAMDLLAGLLSGPGRGGRQATPEATRGHRRRPCQMSSPSDDVRLHQPGDPW